ncbi:MAG: hypothetical protein ABJH52_07185 [Henriciella sp.]
MTDQFELIGSATITDLEAVHAIRPHLFKPSELGFHETVAAVTVKEHRASLIGDKIQRVVMLVYAVSLDTETGALIVNTEIKSMKPAPDFFLYRHDAIHLALLRSHMAAYQAEWFRDHIEIVLIKDAA